MAKLYGSVGGTSKQIKKLYGSVNGVSKQIKKLYGSVNGVSKLIYTSGYVPTKPYGIVYYSAYGSDTVLSTEIQSQTEFNYLCQNYSWTNTIGGVSMSNSKTSGNVVRGIDVGYQITSIPNNFLAYCASITDGPVNIPDNVTTIGSAFMFQCSKFNAPLEIPDSVSSIGSQFIAGCVMFNQDITLPGSLTSLGGNFMLGCNDMISEVNVGSLPATIATSDNYTFATAAANAACYVTGIKIAGSTRVAWRRRFPNRTSTPYRKTLDAGH